MERLFATVRQKGMTMASKSRLTRPYSTVFAISKVILKAIRGGVEQLVAYLLGSQEVAGSKPAPAPNNSAVLALY